MTTTTRRCAALGAALALGLPLAGCGGGGSGDGDGDEIVVSVMDAMLPQDPIDVAAREFEKANPGVRVTVRKTPFDQHMQKVRRQLGTNRAPDVVGTLLGYGESAAARSLADKGLLADLTAEPWTKEIRAVDRLTTGDGTRTFAYPASSMAIGTFYDPRVLARARVPIPKTFSDVLALCRKSAAKGTPAFAMSGQDGTGMPHFLGFALAASTAYADDPRFGERRLKGETTFAASAGWARANERFKQMKDAGCFDKDAVGISRDAAGRTFGRGKTLLAVAPTVTLPLFQAGDPKARFEMFPFPGGDAAAGTRVATGPATGFVVPTRSRAKDLAKKFIAAYAENRGRYAQVDGSVSGIPAGGDDPGVPAFARALAPHLKDGRTAPIMDQQWPNPEVHTQHAGGLVQILLGRKAPRDVLADMDRAWTAKAP